MPTKERPHPSEVADLRLGDHGLRGDQISLFDLWNVLARRRWWIAGACAVMALTAIVYLAFAAPVFESRAVIRIGRLAGELVAPADVLALQLSEKYAVGESGRSRPYLSAAKKQGEDAIVLEAEAHSAADAQRFLSEVVRDFLSRQQLLYQSARQPQEAALTAIDAQLGAINSQLDRLARLVGNEQTDDAVRALAVLQQSTLQSMLPALHDQRLRVQYELSTVRSFPMHILREPTLAEDPVAPRRTLILVFSLVAGGMLGIMVALFVEFAKQARAQSRAREIDATELP